MLKTFFVYGFNLFFFFILNGHIQQNQLEPFEDDSQEEKTKSEKVKASNRLIKEKSPYLLQHAYNPVDWYSWGNEAFAKARKEDKPIFLSVGYSTCYWCHVMEREIFENDSIAKLMNQYVVSIKVDREERPDIDRVYMTALQGMTGGGGWPMSLFLTPDLKPFYAGTYIPPESKWGKPGFRDLLLQIHDAWKNDRQKLLQISTKVENFLNQSSAQSKSTGVNVQILDKGFQAFVNSYDSQNG
ncbi:MAG: thioredoxin domain-containing protein, partial [Ignavibacteriae bacterium]|nr:thioredoxin domain-containing protein [Ignavibacteriota bacterium]